MELQAARASGDTRRMERLFAAYKGEESHAAAAANVAPLSGYTAVPPVVVAARPAPPATNTVGVQVTEMCDTSTQVAMDSEEEFSERRQDAVGGRGSVPAASAATVREDDVHATRRAMASGLAAGGFVPARSVLQVSVYPPVCHTSPRCCNKSLEPKTWCGKDFPTRATFVVPPLLLTAMVRIEPVCLVVAGGAGSRGGPVTTPHSVDYGGGRGGRHRHHGTSKAAAAHRHVPTLAAARGERVRARRRRRRRFFFVPVHHAGRHQGVHGAASPAVPVMHMTWNAYLYPCAPTTPCRVRTRLVVGM